MHQTLKHNFSIIGKPVNEIWMSCTVTYDTTNIKKGARKWGTLQFTFMRKFNILYLMLHANMLPRYFRRCLEGVRILVNLTEDDCYHHNLYLKFKPYLGILKLGLMLLEICWSYDFSLTLEVCDPSQKCMSYFVRGCLTVW